MTLRVLSEELVLKVGSMIKLVYIFLFIMECQHLLFPDFQHYIVCQTFISVLNCLEIELLLISNQYGRGRE